MSEYFDLDEMKQIGPRVFEILKNKGLPVKKAAKDLNIEISHYYRLLGGKRSFTIDNIIAHCLYLNVGIIFLLFGENGILAKPEDNMIPGDIEVLIEQVIAAIRKLDNRERQLKAAKLLRECADLLERM